jgi:hypothetical protein
VEGKFIKSSWRPKPGVPKVPARFQKFIKLL